MNPLLSVEDVAAYVGKSPRWVARAAGRGDLPAMRFGKTLRFTADDVTAFMDWHRIASPVQAPHPENRWGRSRARRTG